MAKIYDRSQIERAVKPRDLIQVTEEGFVAYSQGKAVIPPIGELVFADPPGDCHIKYGYLRGSPTFTIKIATGFYGNADLGISSSNGIILVFSSKTGELLTILDDQGFLTDVRTAAAGAVAARLLTPPDITCIGIIGAGIQAKLQLDYLRYVLPTRKAMVWARSSAKAHAYQVDGFEIQVANSVAELAAHCNLIVTTTPSRHWLLAAADVHPGTHITAVGSDSAGKQELEAKLFVKAKVRAVDSRTQCAAYGDSSHALKEKLIDPTDLIEIGEIAANPALGRQCESDITIADLTGVAIQDIQAAGLTVEALTGENQPFVSTLFQAR